MHIIVLFWETRITPKTTSCWRDLNPRQTVRQANTLQPIITGCDKRTALRTIRRILNKPLKSNMQCTRRSLEKLTNHVISERLDFSMDRFKCSSFIKACWSSRLQAVRRMYSLAWVQIPPAWSCFRGDFSSSKQHYYVQT